MTSTRRFALQFSFTAMLAACASQGPYRTLTQVCDLNSNGDNCEEYSFAERHQLATDPRSYALGVVEFDDQGMMLHPEQFDLLFKEIERRGQEHDLAIVVYVHGWYNNA